VAPSDDLAVLTVTVRGVRWGPVRTRQQRFSRPVRGRAFGYASRTP
jgi:hypothetical protein